MAVTISLYNHTRARFASGANAVGDTYKLQLLTAATFDATHTTLAAAGGTEVANGNGYTTGGTTLTNVVAPTVNTDESKFDADDALWNASGGSITANYARLYNDTDANDPPVAFIDFGGSESAGDGTPFKVVWHPDGILTFRKPA
jgi:hypothetical protein